MSDFNCTTPLEVMSLYFYWTPLEVGLGYRTDAAACLCINGVGCVHTLCASGDKDSIVCQSTKIVLDRLNCH